MFLISSLLLGHINNIISNEHGRWRFSRLYGNPISKKKARFINFDEEIMWVLQSPLDSQGNFNEIIEANEKKGEVGSTQVR